MGTLLRAPRDPRTVEFDELACCALRLAMSEPANMSAIRGFKERALDEYVPRHVLAVLAEDFRRTTRLVFIPRALHREFYLIVGFAEKKRLASLNFDALSCGHKKDSHIDALGKVIFSMNHPYGTN